MAFGAVLAFTSCEDALDTTNYTEADNTNFPARPVDMESQMAALYAVMPQMTENSCLLQSPFYYNCIVSDDCVGAGGVQDHEVRSVSHMVQYNENQYVTGWKLAYRGIYRANTVIESVDNVNWKGLTEARNQALGEGYFMRAMFYFDAVKMWNNVPMPLSTVVPENCPEQSAEDVIMPQILSDLYAACKLMTPKRYSGTWDGHATKWAAEALLARAYLFYEGFYKKQGEMSKANPEPVKLVAQEGVPEGTTLTKQDVIDFLKDCIDESGHDLVGDYRNLWQYTNELTVGDYDYTSVEVENKTGEKFRVVKNGVDGNPLLWAGNGNKEELFGIKYNNVSDWNTSEKIVGACVYSNTVSLYSGLRCDADKNKKTNGGYDTFPFGQGWGQGQASANLWDDWKRQEIADGEEDIRRTATIIDNMTELDHYAIVTTGVEDVLHNMKKYIAVKCKQSADGLKVWDGGHDTWWCFLPGFQGTLGNNQQGANFADLYLIRLADVYLMHTELTGDATYMNKVRARAGLKAKEYTWKNLQNERRWELACEGLRYQDLRRWSGKGADANSLVCKALDAKAGQTIYNLGEKSATPYKHMNSSWSARYTATDGFIWKPKSEIELSNGGLTQNPGWDTPDAAYRSMYE